MTNADVTLIGYRIEFHVYDATPRLLETATLRVPSTTTLNEPQVHMVVNVHARELLRLVPSANHAEVIVHKRLLSTVSWRIAARDVT